MQANDERAAGEEPEDEGSNPGHVLKAARTALGLSLEQIAAELRIEPRRLLALEENRFEDIGAPVFVKGYLRQYGRHVGLDYGDLLTLYYRQTDVREVAIQPSRAIKLRDERQITLWVVAGAVFVVLAALLLAWWLRGSSWPI